MTKQHDTILAQFGSEPISPVEIMRATGLSKNQIHNGIQRLKDKGRIVHVGEGLYRIADTPELCGLPMVEVAVRRAHPLHMVWF